VTWTGRKKGCDEAPCRTLLGEMQLTGLQVQKMGGFSNKMGIETMNMRMSITIMDI